MLVLSPPLMVLVFNLYKKISILVDVIYKFGEVAACNGKFAGELWTGERTFTGQNVLQSECSEARLEHNIVSLW